MNHDRDRRHAANAEVLLWQSRVRASVAVAIVATSMVFREMGLLAATSGELAIVGVGYLAAVAVLFLGVSRTRRAPNWMVSAAILADLLFVFAFTLVATAPEHYERSLILAFFVLHLAESHFGRAQATFAVAVATLGFLALVAPFTARGGPLVWGDQLLALGAFLVVGIAFIVEHDGFRARLSRLAALFERAQEGDLSEAYDVEADRRPDAITLVGRAYNRVRSQLESLVLTDPLTECMNRRGFEQSLARELARSTRAESPLSLLALDLDHFKAVNDTRGHIAGDAVLREVAAVLLRSARAGDAVARTGGEEFSIVLPDTDARGAFQLAQRICDTVRDHAFAAGSTPTRLTISVGVVTIEPKRQARGDDRGAVVLELKVRADEALYAAKRSGRDRVRVWTPALARRSGEMRAIEA